MWLHFVQLIILSMTVVVVVHAEDACHVLWSKHDRCGLRNVCTVTAPGPQGQQLVTTGIHRCHLLSRHCYLSLCMPVYAMPNPAIRVWSPATG